MDNKKLEKYKKEGLIEQKYMMLYEAMVLQAKYHGIESPMQLKDEHGLKFDLLNKTTSQLFNELFDDLVENNFKIIFDDSKSKTLREKIYKFNENNEDGSKNLTVLEAKSFISDIRNTENYFNYELKIEGIDFIKVMLDTKQYDKIIKIILSDKITDEHRIHLLERIISNSPNQLKDIFDTIPNDYYFYDRNVEREDYFKQLLKKKLSVLKGDRYIINTIREKMNNTIYNDCMSKFNVREFIKFFVDYDLVNMNNIDWTYNGKVVSSACVGYIRGNEELGSYLYNLPSYKQLDEDSRYQSDMVLLEIFAKDRYEIVKFLKNKNFEATPEKLKHLEKTILKIQAIEPDYYKSTNINEIVQCFLRKTKKQYYKEMQKAISSLQTNSDPKTLRKARERFVRTMQNICNPILEVAPAKAKVGDATKILHTKKNS